MKNISEKKKLIFIYADILILNAKFNIIDGIRLNRFPIINRLFDQAFTITDSVSPLIPAHL